MSIKTQTLFCQYTINFSSQPQCYKSLITISEMTESILIKAFINYFQIDVLFISSDVEENLFLVISMNGD